MLIYQLNLNFLDRHKTLEKEQELKKTLMNYLSNIDSVFARIYQLDFPFRVKAEPLKMSDLDNNSSLMAVLRSELQAEDFIEIKEKEELINQVKEEIEKTFKESAHYLLQEFFYKELTVKLQVFLELHGQKELMFDLASKIEKSDSRR